MIRPTLQILKKAKRDGYAVPAFNINNLEILQGIIAGAVKLHSPVIVQTSPGAIEYAGMENLALLVHSMAKTAPVPIALHLDHGKKLDEVKKAINSGYYQSVMYDGSSLSYQENIANTKKITQMAHKKKIAVEAELGAIPGKEDLISVSRRDAFFTDPKEAREFVQKTGCDSLAISIGTAHGANKFAGKSHLDFSRLSSIAKLVSLPLVLHGASSVPRRLKVRFAKYCSTLHDCERLSEAKGVSETLIRRVIKLGISKINVDTDLRIAFIVGIREDLITDHGAIDPREILGHGRKLVTETVMERIRLLGSVNNA
jgi:fructose-bisphosphate aldolase class II